MLVIGCDNCRTEWNTTQKNSPKLGSTCYECKDGTITPIVTARERQDAELAAKAADNQQCFDITLVCSWCATVGWPYRIKMGVWKHAADQTPTQRITKCNAQDLWEHRYVQSNTGPP